MMSLSRFVQFCSSQTDMPRPIGQNRSRQQTGQIQYHPLDLHLEWDLFSHHANPNRLASDFAETSELVDNLSKHGVYDNRSLLGCTLSDLCQAIEKSRKRRKSSPD